MTSLFLASCDGEKNELKTPCIENFNFVVDRFADVEILRYRVVGFENLTLQQKKFIYFLSQAALEGRDILFDQHGKYNLVIRRTLEAVFTNYAGDKNSQEFAHLTTYLKQVWMGNGIHHHHSADKFVPKFSESFFANAVNNLDSTLLPLADNQSVEEFIAKLTTVIFDPTVMPRRMNQTKGEDLVLTSTVNFYRGVTQAEAENFYNAMKNPNDARPVQFGLNSRLEKKPCRAELDSASPNDKEIAGQARNDSGLIENVWKIGGLYSEAIERIVYWLEKAVEFAENNSQKEIIRTLIDFYHTGCLAIFDEFSVLWVQDLESQIDFLNGFIESYSDPLGMKGSWEGLVNFRNPEATKRTELISRYAQWFEDNSPIAPEFKKDEVVGVSASVVTVAMLSGDCYPAAPLGINLPNSNWIRRDYGSKSVTLDNISEANNRVSLGNGFAEEFMWSELELERAKKYGSLTNTLLTDLHECLGHGSGKLLPGVDADALGVYGAPIEEARADLFALYYIADPKMLELGLLSNAEACKAQYYHYMMNGLMTQLTRIELGKNIEQAHMRNRQLVASWVFERGNLEVVELVERNGKCYMVIHDYERLRGLFAELLIEIQRVKSTGDFEAARNLVETYGVGVNQSLHAEVLERFGGLNLAPFRGFVNPVYTLVKDRSENIIDVQISYDENFVEQQLRYSRDFSTLPMFD